jgi:hypothetical protein
VTTPEQCIDALLAAADRFGKSPTRAEYDTLKQKPASGTIMRVMGGWNAAKEAAGLDTYYQGESGGTEIQPKPDSVDLPEGYEWDKLNSQQRWYYKNREHRAWQSKLSGKRNFESGSTSTSGANVLVNVVVKPTPPVSSFITLVRSGWTYPGWCTWGSRKRRS